MDEHDDDGFELLAAALAAAEADGAALPAANLRAALEGARAIGLSFDVAWGAGDQPAPSQRPPHLSSHRRDSQLSPSDEG